MDKSDFVHFVNYVRWHCTILMKTARLNESVIFGSLTLRKARALNFGVKFNFSKIRMEPVMHDSLAITENRKREIRTIE